MTCAARSRYGTDGTLKAQLTSGEWQVRGVERVDPKSRTVFFSASGREPGRDPYLQHLYRVSFDGGEPPVLLTPEPAEHGISFSPDGSVFVRFSLASSLLLGNIMQTSIFFFLLLGSIIVLTSVFFLATSRLHHSSSLQQVDAYGRADLPAQTVLR